MKIAVVVMVLAMVIVLAGCSSSVVAVVVPAEVEATVTQPAIPYVANNEAQMPSVSDAAAEAKMIDKDWVTPAQVDIGNYYPGARAEFSLRVHNGGNEVGIYDVSYMEPTNTKDGYSMPPASAGSWVTVPGVVVVLPKETKKVLVVLEIPKDAKIDGDWEFWTSVMRQGQGNVQTQVATRWLIKMR